MVEVQPTRAERLAADRAEFLELIERSGASDWEQRRAALAPLYRGADGPRVELDGWAVLRGELESMLRRGERLEEERANRAIAAFRHYTEQLGRVGVELLIVPVPLRLELYGDRLASVPSLAPGAIFSVANAELFAEAVSSRLEVLPLLPAFSRTKLSPGDPEGERLFLDYDTHWTPRGARLAADRIAGRALAMTHAAAGPFRAGEDFRVSLESRTFAYPPSGKREVEFVFESVLDLQGRPAEVRDADSPVLLIGDSFANFYSAQAADLTRLLYARLGQRLDVIGLAGSGGSAWKALARRDDPLRGKQLVIWLFTSSTLGNESFDLVELIAD